MLRKALRTLAQYGPAPSPIEPSRDAAPGACLFCGTKWLKGEKKCSKCGKEVTADTDTNIFFGQPLSENLLENKPTWSKKMKKNAEKWDVVALHDSGKTHKYETFESKPAAEAFALGNLRGCMITEFDDGGSEWDTPTGKAFIEKSAQQEACAGHAQQAATTRVPKQLGFAIDEAKKLMMEKYDGTTNKTKITQITDEILTDPGEANRKVLEDEFLDLIVSVYKQNKQANRKGFSARHKNASNSTITTEQVVQTFGIDSDLAEEIVDILDMNSNDDDSAYKALEDVDRLLGGKTYGVEGIMGEHSDRNMYYLNTGDTYKSTIVYDDEEGFYIGNFGDWVEGVEGGAQYDNELDAARLEMESITSDIESGYLEEYTFTDQKTLPDSTTLGQKYFSYLWDEYVSNGKIENVGDIVEDQDKAIAFLKEEGFITETQPMEP